jgi:hypothetical protein
LSLEDGQDVGRNPQLRERRRRQVAVRFVGFDLLYWFDCHWPSLALPA